MKKILLFIAFVMSGMFVQAQNSQMDRAQEKEMDVLTKIVTFEHKNLTFNKNQTAKLERLFFKKSTELVALRNNKDLNKGDYAEGYKKIQAKYRPLVEAILSPTQKVEYRRNLNKKIIKLKD